MTDNFSECSPSVTVENKPTLCSPQTFSAFKNGISVPLFKTLHPNNGLRSYTQFDETVRLAMNYDIPFVKTIENVVTLFQTHMSACVDTEKERKLTFLTRQLELLSQKQFSMNYYCFALQSYPKCNYEEHTCLRTAIDLENGAYIERCTTDVTPTVREECSAAYVTEWLEMKCADDVSFSAEEPLVTSDVKDFIEAVSRGSLTTPHVCTFDLVKCGLCFIKEARHRACWQKRLLQILSTLASFGGIDIDCPKMFRRLANVLLNGLHNLEKDQQKNAVLLQTSVKKARLTD
ncbi:hypothetical protein FHG87_004740 [Trinorchestia longiramus]|nr:hypothetical protein FHG87_004740 [Trinorchestia longiramus]